MSAGQCTVDPVTGIAGAIYSAWIANGNAGFGSNLTAIQTQGTAARNLLAAQIESFATSINGVIPVVPSATPQWFKVTKTHADLAVASTAANIDLYTLPAGGVIHNVKLKHSAAFTGGMLSAYTLGVGVIGTLAKYSPYFDVFQAAGGTVFQLSGVFGSENHGAPTAIQLSAISTGANLSAATTGSVDVWLLVSVAV